MAGFPTGPLAILRHPYFFRDSNMYYRRKRFISIVAVLMATCLIGAVGLSVYTHFAGTYRYPPVGSLEEINLRFVQL